MALDPLYFAVRDSVPHGLRFDKGECADCSQGHNVKNFGAGCADGRKWSHAIFGASVKRSDTGRGKSEECGEGVEIDNTCFAHGGKLFLAQLSVATFGTNLFHWNDSFHGYITGRRREGAIDHSKSCVGEIEKEGIQRMTDSEDMSNAFACTSANCRAEVLEELINETDRPMFF